MLDLLASAIIIQGNSNGVWSPSHPDLFPPPSVPPLTVSTPKPLMEERYIPETHLRYDDGTLVVK